MRNFNFIFGFILLAVLNTGCSLIGLSIGAVSDAKKTTTTTILDPQKELATDSTQANHTQLKPGTILLITAIDGDQIKGKFEKYTVVEETMNIELKVDRDRIFIPLEQVSQIEIKTLKSSGQMTGFLIGATVDAVIIIAAIHVASGLKQMTNDQGSTDYDYIED